MESLQELYIASEKLKVAEEELHQQNEELGKARMEVEGHASATRSCLIWAGRLLSDRC